MELNLFNSYTLNGTFETPELSEMGYKNLFGKISLDKDIILELFIFNFDEKDRFTFPNTLNIKT
jgi:hypothetical protein